MIKIGRTYKQMAGDRLVRLVKVVKLDGEIATVMALHGPLAGTEYPIHIDRLV